jgi:hypothetical protein
MYNFSHRLIWNPTANDNKTTIGQAPADTDPYSTNLLVYALASTNLISFHPKKKSINSVTTAVHKMQQQHFVKLFAS